VTVASGAVLRRNVLLNIAGFGFPAVLALIAIPVLVRGYGDSRFGVLSIAWAVIGYFGLFDLGLSRALTQRLAESIGRGAHHEVGPVSRTALFLMTPIGLAGGVLLAALAPMIVERVLNVPKELQAESVTAFRIFAIAVPFTVFTAGLRGILEAGQRFGAINLLRVPLGLLTFGGPLIALYYSPSLVAAAWVLSVGRIVIAGLHWFAVVRAVPAVAVRTSAHDRIPAIPLLKYGGWMTVSNVISPLMNTMDRFGLGALLPVAAVAYYATSFELVTKVWLLTAAVLPVLFPAMTAALHENRAAAVRLFDRGALILLAVIAPVLLVMVLFALPGISWWVNPEFGAAAAPSLQWLAAAMAMNIVAQVALTLVQAAGRPDLSAKFHLAELPVYALLLWFLVGKFGALGAALAWGIRVVADAVLLLGAAARIVPEAARAVRRAAILGAIVTAALVGVIAVLR
jgi:O-antigen/teichoic acid export membrane protein